MSNTNRDPNQDAENLGCEVIRPAKNELQIDIDCEADWLVFMDNFRVLQETEVASFSNVASRSGKPWHTHVSVMLAREISMQERILLQAALGSDRKREILGWQRMKRGVADKDVSVLFRKL